MVCKQSVLMRTSCGGASGSGSAGTGSHGMRITTAGVAARA